MSSTSKIEGSEDPSLNSTDRAIRAVRDFQAGKATSAFTVDALKAIDAGKLSWVAMATRVPQAQLERMRNG